MLAAPVLPCFLRAPTDNDVGGSGGTSHAARWMQLGVDRLVTTSASLELEEQHCERVVVRVQPL